MVDRRGFLDGTQRRVVASGQRKDGCQLEPNWTLSNSFGSSRVMSVGMGSSRSGPTCH
jgi:hypothetical protein